MDSVLFEQLLNEDESATLDFKRDQYAFQGAGDHQKSELLKDILAFANAYRRTDAYILIGVDHLKGGRSRVVGVTSDLDDAQLQQFVNSKTNRVLAFSYEVFVFEGVRVGIIHIPLQERPLYLEQDYGKLKKHVVYVRRGSSTSEASPDEVHEMGMAAVAGRAAEPALDLQFTDAKTRQPLGTSIEIESTIVSGPPPPRTIGGGTFSDQLLFSITGNPEYHRELAEYVRATSLLRALGFTLKNTGSILAVNACLQIVGERREDVKIIEESEYPERPKVGRLYAAAFRMPNLAKNRINVEYHGDEWTLTVKFGSVQPQATARSSGYFYVGAEEPTRLEIEALIYCDNLGVPMRVPLAINFTTKHVRMTQQELEAAADAEGSDEV